MFLITPLRLIEKYVQRTLYKSTQLCGEKNKWTVSVIVETSVHHSQLPHMSSTDGAGIILELKELRAQAPTL